MSWLTIIALVIQLLKALGVFDRLVRWVEEWLKVGAGHMPTVALAPDASEADTKAVLAGLFATSRKHAGPLERLALRIVSRLVLPRAAILHAHLVGPAAGMPIEPAAVPALTDEERMLLSHFNP